MKIQAAASRRITSRENPLVRNLVRLASSSRERRVDGVALLDGPHLVESLAQNGLRADILCASDSGLRHVEIERLFAGCPAQRRVVLPDRLFEEVSAVASPAGILAVMPVPDPGALPAVVDDAVMLEAIQDTGNAGAILRATAAAGLSTVIACKGTAFLWSPKVLRAAMGAHFRLRLYECEGVGDIAGRAAGDIVATSGQAAASVFDMDLRGPVIWVFGNEGAGLSDAALRTATRVLRIPMAAGTESLNVAMTASVCLFEQMRQRTGSGFA